MTRFLLQCPRFLGLRCRFSEADCISPPWAISTTFFPEATVDNTARQATFNKVFVVFHLTAMRPFASGTLSLNHLFREVIIWHPNNVASSAKNTMSNHGFDTLKIQLYVRALMLAHFSCQNIPNSLRRRC